jgi:hypothetical protein
MGIAGAADLIKDTISHLDYIATSGGLEGLTSVWRAWVLAQSQT